MKILLIDTCGTSGNVAVADTERSPVILASDALPGRTSSERLVPAIRALVEAAWGRMQAIDVVVVVHGPGSFTGIRVGVSAAKGLCEALRVPVVAMSRLAVLASLEGMGSRVCALLDAGRGEFYFGEFDGGVCLREALLTRDEVLAAVNGGKAAVVVACDAAVAAAVAELGPALLPEPTAADALTLVLQRIAEERFDDVASLDANYVRRTDAEIFAKPAAARAL